jgi:hypothetical protein
MATEYLIGTYPGPFNGRDYTDDLATLNSNLGYIKTAIDNLVLALKTEMIGQTASSVPGTLANSSLNIKILLKAMALMSEEQATKMTEGLGAMSAIASQLAGLSSTMAAGVATNQIIAADQINKNAFDKTATQAALKRNNLPEVTVTSESLVATIQNSIESAGNIAAQASATGFVTSTANKAITSASNYVTDMLPSKGTIVNFFKGNTVTKAVDTEGTAKRVTSKTLIDSVT